MKKNEKFLTELKKELNIKLNEYEMASKTISDMIRRGIDNEKLEKLKESNNDLFYEIRKIRNYINSIENEENSSVEYEYYVEDDRNINFFDNIKKVDKDFDINKESNKNPYKAKNMTTTNKYLDEINDTIDSRVMANRFIVDLSELNIKGTMVYGVDYWGDSDSIEITIYDHIIDMFGDKMPIIQLLETRKDPFNFSISKIDATEKLIYKEKYTSARICQVAKYSMQYDSNDFAKIRLLVKYDNVDYETTQQKNKC